MKILEIGDKVYNVKRDGFEDLARYSFSVVVKTTKTLAILKNGVRLKNDPKISYIMDDVGYSVYRDYATHWHLVSLNAIRQAQIENEKIKAVDWFQDKIFTNKEKQIIYKQFLELNLLGNVEAKKIEIENL
ncbi:pyruvate kinase [uncultured Maribacter sp.]|uniref:pyruvate kinase n=1 Tax=uncultured Maribacter sp. TaxID=431308 RepID=UPI0026199F9B|nr:pyruvate kinase [uncultured Maribacter sp.]